MPYGKISRLLLSLYPIMTRAKKKMPSVAGQTFTPYKKKKPEKEAFHPDSYRTRKQKNQAAKKKQKSVYQQHLEQNK